MINNQIGTGFSGMWDVCHHCNGVCHASAQPVSDASEGHPTIQVCVQHVPGAVRSGELRTFCAQLPMEYIFRGAVCSILVDVILLPEDAYLFKEKKCIHAASCHHYRGQVPSMGIHIEHQAPLLNFRPPDHSGCKQGFIMLKSTIARTVHLTCCRHRIGQ